MSLSGYVSKGCMTFGLKFLMVSQHLAKCDDYKHCGSRSIANLLFRVTLLGHVINEPLDFFKGSSLLYIPTLLNLVARYIVVVEI